MKWFLSILIHCFSSKLILALNEGRLAYVLNLLIFVKIGLDKVKTVVCQHSICCKTEYRLSTTTYMLSIFYYPSKIKILQPEILKRFFTFSPSLSDVFTNKTKLYFESSFMITESEGRNIPQTFCEWYMIACDYKAEDLLDILCPDVMCLESLKQ